MSGFRVLETIREKLLNFSLKLKTTIYEQRHNKKNRGTENKTIRLSKSLNLFRFVEFLVVIGFWFLLFRSHTTCIKFCVGREKLLDQRELVAVGGLIQLAAVRLHLRFFV